MHFLKKETFCQQKQTGYRSRQKKMKEKETKSKERWEKKMKLPLLS